MMLKYNEQEKLSNLNITISDLYFQTHNAMAIFRHSYAQGIDWQYINI